MLEKVLYLSKRLQMKIHLMVLFPGMQYYKNPLTKQRREWAYRFISKISTERFNSLDGEEWRRDTPNTPEPVSCVIFSKRINLPNPLLGINFETNRVSEYYGIATNVNSRADDAFMV